MKYKYSAAVGDHFEIVTETIDAKSRQNCIDKIRQKYKGKQLVIKSIQKQK